MKNRLSTNTAGLLLATMAPLCVNAMDMDTTTNREYLASLYFSTMQLEAQDWDIQDSNYLQWGGVNALDGGVIAPRDWTQVKVVSASPQELDAAFKRLNYAISSGAVNTMPVEFSHALVAYDCWVGQQKAEPNASHNTTRCRDQYMYYAQYLPEPVPPTKQITVVTDVPMVMKELHKVYFAWDKYDLSADAKAKLDSARDTLIDAGKGKLVIGGYTDASGSREYNQELSRKRAQAVADYLRLNPGEYEIDVNAYGEDQLQVQTADGVREQANRVAIVGIRVVKDVSVEETKTVPAE